jgi:hypothetical protein
MNNIETNIKPGIYNSQELSNEDYHADTAIGSTVIKDFYKECPKYCYEMHFGPNRKRFKEEANKSKTYSEVGSNAHFLLLEREKFDQFYEIAPDTYKDGKGNEKDMNKNSNFWKDLKKETEKKGKKLVTNKELNVAYQMAQSINAHSKIRKFFTGGLPECSFFIEDPETGLILKSRPDYLKEINERLYMVDYKSSGVSLSVSKQDRTARDQMRHIQGAHHKHVTEIALSTQQNRKIEVSHVLYVTGSQKPPYIVDDPKRLPEPAIEGGDIIRRMVLRLIKEAQETGHWMGYSEWHAYLNNEKYNFIQDYQFNEYDFNQWNYLQERFLGIEETDNILSEIVL